ncbi:Crp/Fnr family transcriptional regulator [Cellulophaga baltica 4]|nr:Crp/Fnr family transcriptional regulator [Cellulophaga baltica 4]
MKLLEDCITTQVSMDKKSLESVLSKFEKVEIKKNEYVLQSGKVCREMAFIATGYLRMYDIADGKEISFWIGSSGKFITSVSSFVFQTQNFWNIQAITDCTLYVISREKHMELCKTEPKWLEFDNLLLAHSFALLEKSMFSQLHTTAKERFENLMEEDPELFQHVPLHYIASMIGIAPESLSRLRKNLVNPIS